MGPSPLITLVAGLGESDHVGGGAKATALAMIPGGNQRRTPADKKNLECGV